MSIRLAILLDAARAEEEMSSMSRLAVALSSTGMRTVLGIADGDPNDEGIRSHDGPVPRFHLPARTPFWLRKGAAQLASELFEAGAGDGPLDAIVVSGSAAFDLARRTAGIAGCPLIVDVRSRSDAEHLLRHDDGTMIAVSATEPLSNRLGLRIDPERVECIRPCLPPMDDSTALEGRFIVVLGPLKEATVWIAVLDGIQDATSALPEDSQPMIALELGEGRTDMQVWTHARARGLLHRIVSIGGIDQLRPLLSSAASIVLPESERSLRSIIPQAMHRGAVPVAADDPDMDYLEDGVSACIVRASETRRASAWGEAIETAMDEGKRPALAAGAIASAEGFLASTVAEAWSTLLHSIVHGDSIPLRDP